MSIVLYSPTIMTLAEWIKNLRMHLDLTQAQMAQRVYVTMPAYQKWEYSKTRPQGPAMKLLADMASNSGYEPPPEQLETIYGPRRREAQ